MLLSTFITFALFLPVAVQANGLRLTTEFDNDYVQMTNATSHYLEILVETPSRQNEHRLPLNMALVIDTSGSMSREKKLDYVKQAAKEMLQRLDDRDHVSIITYDNEARLLVPGNNAGSAREMGWVIDGLKAGGSTNMSDGLEKGYQQLRRYMTTSTVNRLLLLSDGRANRGITNPGTLSDIVLNNADASFSLSTFGVGLDFNEDLMAALSESGRGMYYFIDQPGSINDILRQEFRSVETLAAIDIKVTITLAPELEIEQVFANDYEVHGNTITVRFGDLSCGQRRRMQIRYVPRFGKKGIVQNAARVEVSYLFPGEQSPYALRQTAALNITDDSTLIRKHRHTAVNERSAVFEIHHAKSQATKAWEENRVAEATTILQNISKRVENISEENERIRGELQKIIQLQRDMSKPLPQNTKKKMRKKIKHRSYILEGC